MSAGEVVSLWVALWLTISHAGILWVLLGGVRRSEGHFCACPACHGLGWVGRAGCEALVPCYFCRRWRGRLA